MNNKRYKANIELVNELGKLVMYYPDMRFSQILENFGYVSSIFTAEGTRWQDEFHLESTELLKRVNKKVIKD